MSSITKLEQRGNIKGLIKLLGHKKADIREEAAKALGRIGSSALEELLQALETSNLVVQEGVIVSLGLIKDPIATEPLLKALQDPNRTIRGQAAKSLGLIGNPEAVEPLISSLSDKDDEVKMQIIEALGEIGDSRALDLLVEALKDREMKVRDSAAKALAKLGASGIDHLIYLLWDGNPMIQRRAEKALLKMDVPIGELLLEASKEKNSQDRKKIGACLNRLRWNPKNDTEKARYLFLQMEWEKLLKLGTEAIEPLTQGLMDEDWEIRRMSAETLGQIEGQEAFEPLSQALKSQDSKIRRSIVAALRRVGDERAVEVLIAALNDPEEHVRWTAAEALGNIGDKRAIEPLVKALNDKSLRVRNNVEFALKKNKWKTET
ncbi:MAG: HEAT repeat domain-containing protein [Candidatus Hermodarchaeota archaeon]